jgi:gamma-glutamylcyclotransferase (GGCT)/AIG2-like uncharacterized protein YtfP/cation transport regulator ChaC
MGDLYFAYGSNLNSADFKDWCAENGQEYPLKKFANAFIPDMRIVFNHNSPKRRGGVLNIRNQFGNAVPGALFQVVSGDRGWETLDRKELAPSIHHKLKIAALTEDGRVHDAETFLVSASLTEGMFVPPHEDYVKIVKQGYAEQGLTDTAAGIFAEIAAGKEPPWCLTHLFVYGTFMRDECRNHILKSTDVIEFAEASTVTGELYDTGKGYPALAPAGSPEGPRVAGELFTLKNPRSAFEILDIVEDFRGYGSQKSVYRRAVIRTETQSGRSIMAWVYMLNGPADNMSLIKSGVWRKP